MTADLTILLAIGVLATVMFCACVGCAIVNDDTVDARPTPSTYPDVVVVAGIMIGTSPLVCAGPNHV